MNNSLAGPNNRTQPVSETSQKSETMGLVTKLKETSRSQKLEIEGKLHVLEFSVKLQCTGIFDQ